MFYDYNMNPIKQCMLFCLMFFKINFFGKKNSEIPSVSNNRDPDQARHSDLKGPDLKKYVWFRSYPGKNYRVGRLDTIFIYFFYFFFLEYSDLVGNVLNKTKLIKRGLFLKTLF